MTLPDNVFLTQHPIARVLLSELRDEQTTPARFRDAVKRLGRFVAADATARLPLRSFPIVTGTKESTNGYAVESNVAIAPVLRAGLGLVDPFLELLPDALIWHVGMGRNEETLLPRLYLNAVPKTMPFPADLGIVYVLDTMLATGGSASAVLDLVKASGAKNIAFVGLLAAPEGVARLHADHPDVPIHLAAIDDRLGHRGYILPGLGDAGDRQFPKY
ncbi:MAG: uracil phosphoribosyltransferase [Candidatus Uhrbacteria bacterium]